MIRKMYAEAVDEPLNHYTTERSLVFLPLTSRGHMACGDLFPVLNELIHFQRRGGNSDKY